MKIIRAHDFHSVSWSGGTSTELFIYPPESSYAERNFLFRFSTAEITSEHSDFTALPGVERILMLLSGSIEIAHEGRYEKKLRPFECDHFSGNWTTKSSGKGRDLNLMLREGCKGNLQHFFYPQNEKGEFNCGIAYSAFHLYYILSGELKFIGGNDLLKEGDLLICYPGRSENPLFIAQRDMHLAEAIIHTGT